MLLDYEDNPVLIDNLWCAAQHPDLSKKWIWGEIRREEVFFNLYGIRLLIDSVGGHYQYEFRDEDHYIAMILKHG